METLERRLLLDCPTTGRPVFTGILLAPAAFQAWRPWNAKTLCPHCSRLHPWSRESMSLDETPPDA